MKRFALVLVVVAIVGLAGSASAGLISVPVDNGDFSIAGPQFSGNWYAFTTATKWKFTDDGYASQYGEFAAGDNYVACLDHVGTLSQDLSYSVNAGDTVTMNFYQGTIFGGGDITATIVVGSNSYSQVFTSADALRTMTYTAPAAGDLSISFWKLLRTLAPRWTA